MTIQIEELEKETQEFTQRKKDILDLGVILDQKPQVIDSFNFVYEKAKEKGGLRTLAE